MNPQLHILINGLSIGSGGGYTVARAVLREVAAARPDWRVTIALIADYDLHEEMGRETLPENCAFLRAPAQTRRRTARVRYENAELVSWAHANAVDVVFQLNGMVVRRMGLPTFTHFQDPMPYRREAWNGPVDRLVAALKRRENAKALHTAAGVGFTSQYLLDLICGAAGVTPKRCAVFHNGIPPQWIARAGEGLADWESRPMEIVTVSNVAPYKRQDLVIRALPELRKRPGLANVRYRIIGHCSADYERTLHALAEDLGVTDNLVIEGRVDDDRVQSALAGARCFTLMSMCESFGIPAIEAMSFGTPVVTSDCCAMPEVCGAAADLVTPDDLAQLTDRLARVLTDSAHAEALRRAGVEQVRKFDWANTGRAMADCLDEIATEQSRQQKTENRK